MPLPVKADKPVSQRITRRCAVALVLGIAAITIAAAISPARAPAGDNTRPSWNPAQFLLNAFLLPALEQGALPLRWADPRPAMHCGPNTGVRVNGEPLRVGSAVPHQPFELTWLAHACHPFGLSGPRFDGRVTLTVYREDWGFSATVKPDGLRYTTRAGEIVAIKPGAVTMPQHPLRNDAID